MIEDRQNGISKREFLSLAKQYGLSSVLFAGAAATGPLTLASLAVAAESTYQKRFGKEPKFTLKFGAAGFSPRTENILVTGGVHFARDLEERTDGEIRIEYFGQNQICGELNCVKKTQQGIIDLFTASTQNSAGGAPYLNVLDYAYMFPGRSAQYHFLYHPKSEQLLREPLRKRHGIHMLFSHCELRGLMLGSAWGDKPRVTSVNDLAGTKNRVTGTQLGRIAMQQLDLNPVPVAWEETLDGLKQGLIDGAETWASAAAYANMSPVMGQAVDLRMFCGTEATSMNASVFDGLPGELQDAVMESAYQTQIYVQNAQEAALINVVGASNPQHPDTIFGKAGVPFVELSREALKEAEERSSPEFNPEPWESWRERLNEWSGGLDTYTEIHKIAREVSADVLPENVEPRRWWRSA
ncbi:TRAP transporter substrate-binding protein [Pelagibius sp. Alg239-R121]|uniref:TRAP transporter substrate-binding protein n=1 Tax=Pelagibius sp. Alg239-R121 TaxID=2993448 RepID=UPI0024A769BD|nr:TRAP transporter substrate-binding protein [Pelagibius sp. Alg239-R121]